MLETTSLDLTKRQNEVLWKLRQVVLWLRYIQNLCSDVELRSSFIKKDKQYLVHSFLHNQNGDSDAFQPVSFQKALWVMKK